MNLQLKSKDSPSKNTTSLLDDMVEEVEYRREELENPGTCPLCLENSVPPHGLYKRHWVYAKGDRERPADIELCNACHFRHIHQNEAARQQAHDSGHYWQYPALRQLAERHAAIHGEQLTIGVAEELYNLPTDEDVIQRALTFGFRFSNT